MCRSFGESKRYNQILIQHVPGGECGLRNVFRMNLDLIIIQMKIDLGENLSTSKLIKQKVNAGQWIFIHDGDGIQRPVIHT
jgi:hypothetical protein